MTATARFGDAPEFGGAEGASAGRTLAVELDGQVVRSSVAIEAALRLLRSRPLLILLYPFWLLRGRAVFDREVAKRIEIDPASLCYDEPLLAYLREEKSRGRRVVLTASCQVNHAEAVAEHIGVAARVIASDGEKRLSNEEKSKLLDQSIGSDLWSLPQAIAPEQATPARSKVRLTVEAMRIRQWLKNLLVFVPLVLAHLVLEPDALAHAALAFLAFGLCASSVYIVNDLLDLAEDRRHPVKRLRPFASGALPLKVGILLAPALLAGAVALGTLLPSAFLQVLATYYATTLAYSLYIKRTLLWDVITLAGLYTLRIVAGSAALGIAGSFWLLAFSIFLFFSLALVKRFVELSRNGNGSGPAKNGRSYTHGDIEALSQFGIASGMVSVLVLALYIDSNASKSLYRHPEIIWLICPVMLYLVARIWFLARRNEVSDDPVLFLARDRKSLAAIALAAVLLVLATL